MTEALLLLFSALLFGLGFDFSGLWARSLATVTELKAVTQPFRTNAGDQAREAAARRASSVLARYATLSVGVFALITAVSVVPLLAGTALGWTDTKALWTASLDPWIITAGVCLAVVSCRVRARR